MELLTLSKLTRLADVSFKKQKSKGKINMPQVIFKGIEKQDVKKLSTSLPTKLEDASEIPHDWFTVEHLEMSFFSGGEQVPSFPIVQVNWFDRGQDIKDKMADVITKAVMQQGYEQVELFFIPLEKESYYENGEHY